MLTSIESYKIFSNQSHYPLHLGITEAGTLICGTVKSSIGIGILLYEGIGDTIRVSLTDDEAQEVIVAWNILKALKIRFRGVNLISCPTCGRCKVDFSYIIKELEPHLNKIKKNITVAVMGCEVNGPGEAKEADIGIACGKGFALIFKKGKVIEKVKESQIIERFLFHLNEP